MTSPAASPSDEEGRDPVVRTAIVFTVIVSVLCVFTLAWAKLIQRRNRIAISKRKKETANKRKQEIEDLMNVYEWVDDEGEDEGIEQGRKKKGSEREQVERGNREEEVNEEEERFEKKDVNREEGSLERAAATAPALSEVVRPESRRPDSNDGDQDETTNRQASSSDPHELSFIMGSQMDCAICLAHFQCGQRVCESKNAACKHRFHVSCMTGWLLKHEECPMCRQNYLKCGDDDHDEAV